MNIKKVIIGVLAGTVIGVLWILIYLAFRVNTYFLNFIPVILVVIFNHTIMGFGVVTSSIGIKSPLRGIITGIIFGLPQTFLLLNVGIITFIISLLLCGIWGFIIALIVDVVVKT